MQPWVLVLIIAVFGVFFGLRHVFCGMIGLYRVVPVNEAHIRILNNRKEIFSSRPIEEKDLEGKTIKTIPCKSAYWYIPAITKLQRLPLSVLDVPIENIKLNDKDMAKFVCDLVFFIQIDNVPLAVERLILTDADDEYGFNKERLATDLKIIGESIGRTVATKKTINQIYMDRKELVNAITEEVKSVFPSWGISLVNMELRHIKDAEGSQIIADIERKRAAEIKKEADIVVAEAQREAKVKQAEAEEVYRKREIDKDRAIKIAEQEAQLAVEQKTSEANIQKIAAKRKLDVGNAEILKEVVEQQAQAQKIKVEQEAEAQKIKFTTEAEGKAKEITSVGQAEADMILAKKTAEADGTEKLATALQKYNDVAINITKLEIERDVLKAKFAAFGEALKDADIKLILSGDQFGTIFGVDLNANVGANIEQFAREIGWDTSRVLQAIKDMAAKKADKTHG